MRPIVPRRHNGARGVVQICTHESLGTENNFGENSFMNTHTHTGWDEDKEVKSDFQRATAALPSKRLKSLCQSIWAQSFYEWKTKTRLWSKVHKCYEVSASLFSWIYNHVSFGQPVVQHLGQRMCNYEKWKSKKNKLCNWLSWWLDI